jgi:hypothetical protein
MRPLPRHHGIPGEALGAPDRTREVVPCPVPERQEMGIVMMIRDGNLGGDAPY